MTDVLLGVDVGNSKTHVAAATPDGRVLAVVAGPGASPQTLGVAASWQRIDALTGEALRRAGSARNVAAAYAVAGLDSAEDEAAFARPGRTVCNDVFAVLRAGTSGDGIAVVAGAGMNCVGRSGDDVVRFPALGIVSGDWGGGVGLGLEALALACRADDGRGRATALSRRVPDLFDRPTAAALSRAVHDREVPMVDLARLAPLVLELADAGDWDCLALVRRQANEVAVLVRAAAARLHRDPADLPVVLGGGLLTAGSHALDQRLAQRFRALGVATTTAPAPPVVGAMLLAADRAGLALDAARLSARVREQLGFAGRD